jgi:hypothetical protein
MLKQIPSRSNHKIVGYEEIMLLSGLAYMPIQERINPLNKVYWAKGGDFSERVYLIDDSFHAYNTDGKVIDVSNFSLELCNEEESQMFHSLLKSSGYIIVGNAGLRKINKSCWIAMYTPEKGFYPHELSCEDKSYTMYKGWDEAFQEKDQCINWCNYLNDSLRRNYPEL